MSDIWFCCKKTDKVVELSDCLECKEPKNCLSLASYQQGRADEYQEITSEYMLLTEKQVAEIRTDAIEELVTEMKNRFFHQVGTQFDNAILEMERIAEQLKEQNTL